jgi:predicted DNA-binding protein
MAVHLKPETESRLNELAIQSGRPTDELVEDAMAGYLAEVRGMLDGRYEDIKSGRVKPIESEAFFGEFAPTRRAIARPAPRRIHTAARPKFRSNRKSDETRRSWIK